MKKEKICITEERLYDMIRRSIRENFVGNAALKLPYQDNKPENNVVVEMARINKKETGRCYFPFDTWEIKIWSDDHMPPHFHIIRDGWDISFLIETGEVYKVKKKGKDKDIYDYAVSNVKTWLQSKCFMLPKITNQENAILQWEQIHN